MEGSLVLSSIPFNHPSPLSFLPIFLSSLTVIVVSNTTFRLILSILRYRCSSCTHYAWKERDWRGEGASGRSLRWAESRGEFRKIMRERWNIYHSKAENVGSKVVKAKFKNSKNKYYKLGNCIKVGGVSSILLKTIKNIIKLSLWPRRAWTSVICGKK